MGLGLNGCQIDATYPGLIKTCDNSAVTSTYKPITDGNGNDLPVQVSSLGTKFTGDADFTGATVTGLPDQDTTYTISSAQDLTNAVINLDGSDLSNTKVTLVAGTNITLTDDGSNNVTIDASGGAAGLVSGTGVDSMQSDASLTTVAANALGDCSIALGNSATAGGQAVAIGESANGGGLGISIGYLTNTDVYGIALGYLSRTIGFKSVAIGSQAEANQACSIAIGESSEANAARSVAIGKSIIATRADALTTCEIELCAPGGGLYLTTPDGLAQPKLSVDNTSQLLVDGTPVGGGGGAGLVSGTGADSMQSDASLTTVAANAAGTCSIALGNGACASGTGTVAIGNGARAIGYERSITIGLNACDAGLHKGIAIGANSKAGCSAEGTYRGMAIGDGAQGTGGESIAIGLSANTCLYAYGIALGRNTCTTAPHAIAIGANVSASRACALTTCEIELCTAGGGLYLTTPDGLAQPKISVDNSSNLLVAGEAALVNDAATNVDMTKVWSGTEAQYTALGTYDANTLYFLT